MTMTQQDTTILNNRNLKGDYYQVDFQADAIVPQVQPGQFVQVKLPEFEHRILRRPFSIYNAEPKTGVLSIVYKVVGEGTSHLAKLPAGTQVNLLGPLGTGFSQPSGKGRPVIVAGGYGCAATYLVARRSPVPCTVLIGGRAAPDLLLEDEFRALGCDVQVSTNDGSKGHKGLVTALLEKAIEKYGKTTEVFACGPNPMLKAVCHISAAYGIDAEVSLDHAMCCGVGACFACVVKMKADTPEGWEYVRTCMAGPVFKASRTYWD